MENASKALIIAGSILIAIMLISLGIFIFNRYSEHVKNQSDLSEQEVATFNSALTPYMGESIPGSQVNALIQKVISIDYAAIDSGDQEKRVNIDGYVELNNDTINIKIRKVETRGKYFKVTPSYGNSGIINQITIESQSQP